MDPIRKEQLLPDVVLLLAALVWGATFSLIKAALNYTSPFMFMTLRFGLALVIMTSVVAPQLRSITRREWMGGVLTGSSIFFGFTFQTWGLVYTTASKSAFITGLNVVLVPFLLWGLGHQHIRTKRWIAALLATLGLFLLTNPLRGAGLNQGDLLTLACAVAFAGQIILLGIYAPALNTLRYFWVQLLTVVFLAALATSVVNGWNLTPAPALWWGLGITGVFGTTLAFLGMTWAQRRTSPTRTALIIASEPVFGALFAVAIAGEYLSPSAWLGGVLIVGVIAWSELGQRARL
ncbi:MAG: DMT family transporter [Fidelibacterota bacterium]|nr:MAG: DMT family transporter [Candidatus Neomarinimicrobiota bacterium]